MSGPASGGPECPLTAGTLEQVIEQHPGVDRIIPQQPGPSSVADAAESAVDALVPSADTESDVDFGFDADFEPGSDPGSDPRAPTPAPGSRPSA